MEEHWKNRKVLVTGGTGLVGSHLTERLVREGADVVVIVRDTVHRTLFNPVECDVVYGDVTDHTFVRRVLGEYEIDTVFHLAAQTIVGIANTDPLSTWESNIRGTYSLMEAVRLSPKVSSVVVASTDKAYGTHPELPTKETCPLQPDYPYDVSKACADMICRSYAVTFETNVIVTRCGNLFGEGDLNWNRLVPGTIRSFLQGERPVIRSNGLFVRDYLYVGNVVDAYMRLAQRMSVSNVKHLWRGEAYNISDNSPLSVLEMTEKIAKACGVSTLPPIVLGQELKEIPTQYLDTTKITHDTGWTAPVKIDEALERTVSWYREIL